MAEFYHTAYNFLGFYKTSSRFLFLCSLLVQLGLQCTFKSPLVCHAYEFITRLILSHADIDTIEIRSDEEEGSGASKARRTYNYRVKLYLLSDLFYLLLFRLQHFCSTEPEKTLTSSVGSMQVSIGCKLQRTISTVRFKVSARFTFIFKVFSWSSTASI